MVQLGAGHGSTPALLEQNESLHAPVQQFRHVDLPGARTRQPMNAAELFELPTRFTEHAEDAAVRGVDLVDPSRETIRDEQDLVWRRRDAHRPWRSPSRPPFPRPRPLAHPPPSLTTNRTRPTAPH